MGQKTHPLGFRLGITQEHRSAWYADFKHYSNLLEEDDKIRTYLNKLAKFASISNIYINRNGLGDQIELNIETGRPGILVGDNGSEIKTLAANIKNFIPNNRQITINVIEVENVNSNASLIADLVVQQLEDRVAFRRAIREALKCAQDNEVNGIKVQISGRLNGAEMARTEWIREGRVPLQTLRADIDYATKEANTIYGILGVKVWITSRQIEATRRTISRYTKRGASLWIRIFPDKTVTARAAESRMGSGKGSVDYWVATVKPGTILFEISSVPEEVARAAFNLAAYKLPIKTKFIIRNDN